MIRHWKIYYFFIKGPANEKNYYNDIGNVSHKGQPSNEFKIWSKHKIFAIKFLS